MNFIPTIIEGVYIIEVERHGDDRGYFCETFRKSELENALGYNVDWVQDNESLSQKGVVRGLHWQSGQWAQAKLVRVVRGRIVDVVVDLRADSPTFGRHVMVELDAASGRELFIPRGCAHGFAVLEETLFQYKVDNYWHPEAECGLDAYDPALAIDWPFAADKALRSEKDVAAQSYAGIHTRGISPAMPAPKSAKS